METVNLEDGESRGIHTSVSVKAGGRNTPVKKYKLFQVPVESEDYDTICFSLIGQGTNFCMAKYCKMSHQDMQFVVVPG
jgi:hypothetical protein